MAGRPLGRRVFLAVTVAAALACGGGSSSGTPGGSSSPVGTGSQLDLTTDAHNCGAAGNVCASGVCSGGACVSPLVRRVSTDNSAIMQDLAVDGSYVYWFEPVWMGTDTLYRAPVGGGAAVPLDASHTPTQIELVGSELVFGDDSTGSPTPSTGLHVMASSGGPVTDIAPEANLRRFAADASGVCWVTNSPMSVLYAPMAGGTPTPIATLSHYADDVALDADHVYWTDGGDIFSAPRSGVGPTSTLASGVHAQSLQIHDGWMYFSAGATMFSEFNGVFRVPLAGGAVQTITNKRVGVCGFATDGATVYWAECGNTGLGYVMTVPAAGGTPRALTGLIQVPRFVAIDADSVYWNDYAAIWRVPR